MQYLLNRPLRNSKTYSVALLLICVTIYMIHKRITLKKYVIIHWQSITSNVTCHYSNDGNDALPSLDDISSEVRSIFFHETSCRGGLNSRQACAVESAARAHPNWQVYVLFRSPVTHHVLNNSCIAKLLQFPNVKAARINIIDYLRDTPLSNHSHYPMENIGDVLKFVSLYKWGGVSLDLDTMVLRSLESLPQNWVVKLPGTNTIVLTSMLALDKDDVGSEITRTILQKMSSPLWPSPNYTFHSFINGTQAMNDVIELCLEKLHKPYADECNGLTINSHEMFCPIDHRYWYVYYYPGDISDMNVPYTHCLWSSFARDAGIHRESPYAKLAKKYCPDIYDMYGEEFGV